jgi:hypothetical protein
MKPRATWIGAFSVVLAGWLFFYYKGLPLSRESTLALSAIVFSIAALAQAVIIRRRRSTDPHRRSRRRNVEARRS